MYARMPSKLSSLESLYNHSLVVVTNGIGISTDVGVYINAIYKVKSKLQSQQNIYITPLVAFQKNAANVNIKIIVNSPFFIFGMFIQQVFAFATL